MFAEEETRVSIDEERFVQMLERCLPLRKVGGRHPYSGVFERLASAAREVCVVLSYGLIPPGEAAEAFVSRMERVMKEERVDPHVGSSIEGTAIECFTYFVARS